MVSFYQVFLPDNQDFLFYLIVQANCTLYSHIVNHKILKVLVENLSDWLVCIPQPHKLGHLLDIAYDNCFLVDTQFVYNSAAFPLFSQSFSNLRAGPPLSLIDVSIETMLDNKIKMYGDTITVKQISELVSQYPSIWKSQGFVQISPEQWMKVQLKLGCKSKLSFIKPKVY